MQDQESSPLLQQNDNNSNCQNLITRQSSSSKITNDTVSFLNSSKGGLLLNPNGTILHMNPVENSNRLNTKKQKSFDTFTDQQVLLPVFGDDDLAFYLNPNDLPGFVDEIIPTLLKHQKIFIIFTIITMFFEGFFDYVTYYNQDRHISHLSEAYPNMSQKNIQNMFWIFFSVDIAFSLIFYPLGIIAAYKKSFKWLNHFASLALFGILLELSLTYINKFNLVMFFFRTLGYLYSKFVAHLLINLLLLPR